MTKLLLAQPVRDHLPWVIDHRSAFMDADVADLLKAEAGPP